ncbi:hypothetical protein G7Y89_g13503 [Cudoniella acicularis]|uniref:Septation initiation network scaffold protein cdc11 n=1 Tax=Cudoniella acicularis TaxID=354080 RepID=A0A8H4RAJ7_9HELO|nr:hypothetical protein G7Y89_g13503 [Cudoniella acicularis]
MEQAWLDSLSEDWVSQPRSSGSPAPSLPSLIDSTSSSSPSRVISSRIPKYDVLKKAWTTAPGNNNSPLSERSLNNNNIPLSQRGSRSPSKLRDEVIPNVGGKGHARTVSESTSRSTQCHTIQHKSAHVSPNRGTHETPEWKRRLLNGDVAYGEQRDLFSPAGLENIFRPPPPQVQSSIKLQTSTIEEASIIMPSSPPPYNADREIPLQTASSDEDQPREIQQEGKQQTRGIQYKQTDESISEFSANDLSRSSSFQPRTLASHDKPVEGAVSSPGSSVSHKQELLPAPGRVFSGQSDIRNEGLSPIYISRHNTVDGKIDYAMDLEPAELQHRLEQYREETPSQDFEDHESSRIVLEDLTADTDDFAHNGKFVNLRRGGHSEEGSFQKRMLSPSSLPAIDESAMLPEESMQASTPKQLPNIRKTRMSNEHKPPQSPALSPIPHTPHVSPSKSHDQRQETSSGSPLKLFGTYDTFTNQKLLRRLSQFEGDLEGNNGEELPSGSAREHTRSEINEAFISPSNPRKGPQQTKTQQQNSKEVNSFGEGQLDNFQFSEEISYDPNTMDAQDEDKENNSLPVLDPTSQTKFRFQLDPSPALEEDITSTHRIRHTNTTSITKHVTRVRKTIRSASSSSNISAVFLPSQRLEDLETPRKRNGDSEGKRLPKSPLKDPTPKRRRTLQKNDISQADAEEESLRLDSLRETHQQMQSVIGKKRKDARHGDDQQAANPKVLAMRQILRPRTPTPSQRSSQQHERHPLSELNLSSLERDKLLQEQKIAQIQAELDATESPKLAMALGASQQLRGESRKGSVTTQDFLDEAKKIMAGIRGKARPRSGLTSLEESESENDRNGSVDGDPEAEMYEDSYQESTKEPFSRPPSREGGPVPRLPVKQENPELLNHLRKYQEMSDMDGIVTSSMKSIAATREVTDAAKEVDRASNGAIILALDHQPASGSFVESEPPNIRISENPDLQRKRKHSSSSSSLQNTNADSQETDFPSQGSTASSRSIPTGSSRGSDSRRVIAPHTVSHLIPEQLAGMVFDRDRNIWVKRKVGSGEYTGQNSLPSDETEEDPFGDIPDLSVDETQELQRIKVAAQLKQQVQLSEALDSQSFSDSVDPKTKTGEAKSTSQTHAIQHPSGHPQPFHSHHTQTSTKTNIRTEAVEEVETEISINESRIDPSSPQRRRNVTISFSSPLTSIIQPPSYHDEGKFEQSIHNESEQEDDEEGNDSVVFSTKGSRRVSSTTKTRTATKKPSRRISLGGHIFPARPVSRIDEQDEDSVNAGNGLQQSINVIVATPMSARRTMSMALVTPQPSHEIGTLTLSPLSDFTMHQDDESFGLNVSYVAHNERYTHGGNAQRTLSLAIKDLVEKITEVEPYEPFWEHIKQMDLKDKKLTNLHKLDEFCGQLEELDASNNRISQLNGIPSSTRRLQIVDNYLSDLTAWGHLINLQYVDVSHNELESLSAFKYLVHLRGLRADNNKITALDGVSQLDGLLSLRLRGNRVKSLDFKASKLQKLIELDLKDNQICDVQNLKELCSLSDLNLEDNKLGSFTAANSDSLPALKHLRLSGNNLQSIDLQPYPDLRLLYLDRNRLGTITGLLRTKYLDSLSLREQQDGAIIDMKFLSEAFEIRKLFLSGNPIRTFEPRNYFLNLQYLELANCGLESLPAVFGQMVPNTRVLNLNFNALRDIRALHGIVRLKNLHLAGNRLATLRKTANILAQFDSLGLVDLRANPGTLGFYPPVLENSLAFRKPEQEVEILEPFTIGKADSTKDARYFNCLDMPTKMSRRLYEIFVLSGCARIKTLDGLKVDWSILSAKDEVWDSLVANSVFVNPGIEALREEENEAGASEGNSSRNPEPIPEEERWQAEDSFA